MSIISTKPFLIVGELKKRKQILQKMQKLSCSEIKNLTDSEKTQINNTISEIKKMKKTVKKTISTILKYSSFKKQSKVKKLKKISSLNFSSNEIEEICKKAKQILKCEEKINILTQQIKKEEETKIKLNPYVNLNLPLNNFKTKNTTSLLGQIKGAYSYSELFLKLKEFKDFLTFKVVFKTNHSTNIFLIVCNNQLSSLKKTLKTLDFSELTIKTNKTAKEEILNCNQNIKNFNKEILNLKNEIKSFEKILENFKLFKDYLLLREEKYKIIEKTKTTKNTFILKGFLNPKFENKLKKVVEKNNSFIKIFNQNENSPVFFSNNFLISPVETITKTYSMPSKNDIDPNPIMAFFYYTFFGMMFSDAGYGLILVLACKIGLHLKRFKENKNNLRLFFYCGLSTIFWGFMYGSFFGDFVLKFSKRFLNSEFSLSPLWLNTTKNPLTLLVFSILFGAIQIIVGLLIKFFCLTKKRNFKEAFFCVLNWVLILTAICLILIGYIAKTKIFNFISISLIVLGTLITIFFSEFKQKGILRFLKGIVNLYQLTSFVSDLLSYSRLMALGIATGVIADVVNILADFNKNSLLGNVFFVLIFVLGHLINFSINMLGAYVHTNRLQYVEFFSKFYEGGAEEFKPFKLKTKYFNFF